MTTQVLRPAVDVSICAQCNHLCERENTPWNHAWRCGDPKCGGRCKTMIGCIPRIAGNAAQAILSEPPARD